MAEDNTLTSNEIYFEKVEDEHGLETLGLISLGEPKYMQDLEQRQIPLFMTQERLALFKGVTASWD